MANQITITVAGEEQFDRVFGRVDATFEDLTPIWPDVRDKFWEIEAQQFESEGSAGRYGKYQRLTKRYAEIKQQRYPGMKILQATGDLKASLTGQTDNTVYRTSKTEIAIGTSLARGLWHQQGAGRLPVRRPIDISDRQRTDLTKTIQISLVRELRKGVGYLAPSERSF